MNTRQRNVWQQIRQNGQFRFVLGGTVLIGLLGTISSFLYDYGFEYFFNDEPNYLHESERLLSKTLIRLVIMSLAGIYTSYYLWNMNEAKFFQSGQEK